MDETQVKRKTPKAFRLSNQGELLLAALAEQMGVKQTAIVEMAIRRMAKEEGLQADTRNLAESAA